MAYALDAHHIGKRYGKLWALRNCTLQVPRGCVAGLIGLNGAGKTTLLLLATGLLKPTEGTLSVLSTDSQNMAALLPRIGFVSQERSLYRNFTLRETLIMGKKLNPSWDEALARTLIECFKLSLRQMVGSLSGGQQAQLALIMAIAKKPELLLLDEPFAHIDPLVKRDLSKALMEIVASENITLIVSSHNISDLENICDYLIVLSSFRVKLAEDLEQIRASHKLLIGPREEFASFAQSHRVLQASHTGRQSTLLVRADHPITDPAWLIQEAPLEESVLAYLAEPEDLSDSRQVQQPIKEIVS
jgi:ABC-2 type transport system ATP-binding protein